MSTDEDYVAKKRSDRIYVSRPFKVGIEKDKDARYITRVFDTGEDAVIARPRSVVVCGSLSQFLSEYGVNDDQFRSFELYRRHLIAPDIVTFDELYERAKLIVVSSDHARA